MKKPKLLTTAFIPSILAVTLIAVLTLGATASADPVQILSYSIAQTPESGFGCWFHNYTGTMTDTGHTVSGSVNCATSNPFGPARVLNYSSGSGTLNDGAFDTTHLLMTRTDDQGQPMKPTITLHLDGIHTINEIRLLKGSSSFTAITGATVQIGATAIPLNPIPIGGDPLSVLLDLRGTPLAGLPTNQLMLRDFSASFFGGPIDQFGIGEIEVDGTDVVVIPTAGEVVGWGWWFNGQNNVPLGNDFVQVADGYAHSLALRADGSIVGWGDNLQCQLCVPRLNDFVQVASGTFHGVGLRSDGSIVAWGGYLGQANAPAGNDFRKISAGGSHSLALRADGSIVGWGWNPYGQTNVPLGKDFVQVAAGGAHSLALRRDGTLVGWGYNANGQADVPAGKDFVQIAAGAGHSLAIRSDGSIVGWGQNWYGQTNVPLGKDFVQVAAGGSHSLALRADGSIVGWGENNYGQSNVPTGNNFVQVAAGEWHSLAIRSTRPKARCTNVVAPTDFGKCTTNASIDAGSYNPSGNPIDQSPAGPYPLGDTLVTLTVTDSTGASDSCTATVTVVSPPPVAVCTNVTVPTDWGQCTIATNASVDNGSFHPAGKPVTVVQSPAGPYTLGATPVTLTVTDSCGVSASCSATVTVVSTPPVALCTDVTVPTDWRSCTAYASIDAGSNDPDGGPITVAQSPAGPYTLGATPVTFTVTDSCGVSASCSATVTVVSPPPVAVCQNVVAPMDWGSCTAYASIDARSYDPQWDYAQSPPDQYPQGDTLVTLTVTDSCGRSASCSATVTVMGDQEPPVFSVSPTPNLLWPADNKLAPVSLYVPVTDNCDPAPVCRVTGVTSNQPVSGPGYGNTTPDWVFSGAPGDLSLKLRAERSSAESRVYTIAVSCKDSTGNESATAGRVTAPISPASHRVREISLGSLSGGYTEAKAINDRGQIVGFSALPNGSSHAFLWEMGTMRDLTPTPETYSSAVDINNRGQIVGTDGVGALLWQNGTTIRLAEGSFDIRGINEPGQVLFTGYNDSGESRVYLWQNGTTKDLGGPIAEWDPVRMNDRGQVVVTAMFDLDMWWSHAYLWDKGEKIDLGTLGGAEPTAAMVFDINNRGQITGGSWTSSFEGHVFLWENGRITDLITMSGFFDSCVAPALNDLGQAIGSCTDASGNRQGYLWEKGKMIGLGTLGGTYCEPRAINNSGQIVGLSTTASGEEHAFLWESGTMVDLTPTSNFSNARLINSSGQIVGDKCDTDVGCSAVLWTVER